MTSLKDRENDPYLQAVLDVQAIIIVMQEQALWVSAAMATLSELSDRLDDLVSQHETIA